KRRYSRIEQGDDPKIPRDGSAEPEGDKSCNRNGKKVKKNKVAILGATDLGDLEEGDELSVTAEGQQWVAADVPAPPPLPVQNATTTLLLDFIGGETSVGSSGCALQIENLQAAVAVAPWKDQDSLSCNTLVNLSHRLLRAEALDVGLTFTRMINELMFAAKINSILHLVRIGQAEAGQPQRASLEPVFKDLTSQGFAFYSLMTWYSVGSKWGRLAAAGTLYILMVIAMKPGLSVKLRGRRVNATNVIALCNELRCPSTEIHKAFIQHNLL
ncbi:hypothetical protein GGU11DRAFT_835824, partial [Lentinula aff. detonsa]